MFNNEIALAVLCTTLLIVLLVLGIILTFIISGRQKMQQQMELANTKLEFEKELRQVETEVSEQLLSRFAQELHDNIGNQLTAAHYMLENLKLEKPAGNAAVDTIEVYLTEVREQLRLLSRTLNYDYLISAGLISSLQTEVERLRYLKRFEVHWQFENAPTGLDRNQELIVFRIFQEIVQNTLRHSGAKSLHIHLICQPEFELRVSDNGKGFDKNMVLATPRASGLLNIFKRAELVNLNCKLDTGLNTGCLYSIKKVSTLV